MPEIAWQLLQPVDTGAQVQQGFATGMAMVKQVQTANALRSYLTSPDSHDAYSALAYLDPQTAAAAQQQHLTRQKALREQQDRQRAVALGELAVVDPAGAREEALAAGDFDLAKTFGELSEAEQKKTAEFWQQAGSLAFQLKQTPDPQARMALWAEARPILEAQGSPKRLLDGFDPTNDTQLQAAITTSQKIGDLITQSRVTWHQQGEQPSFATDYMGRPVGSQNPYADGKPASEATGAVASTLSSAMPGHVVAGFLGNFEAEGGYGGASGDGGTASGIAQWRGERQANFQRIVGKPVSQASPGEQARFVLWEMQNPEQAGMTVEQRDAILNAPDAATAADLIDRFYERSDGKARAKRIAAAQRLAGGSGGSVQTASLGGKTYYKIDGQWFDNPEGK